MENRRRRLGLFVLPPFLSRFHPDNCQYARDGCAQYARVSSRRIARPRRRNALRQPGIHGHGVMPNTALSSLPPTTPHRIGRSPHRRVLSRERLSNIPHPKYEFVLARLLIRRFLSAQHSSERRFDKLCVCRTAQPLAARSETRLPGGSAPVDPLNTTEGAAYAAE